MTVTIRLSDEQAAALQAQATQEGLTIDAWVLRLAEQQAQRPAHPPIERKDERPIWGDRGKHARRPPEIMATMPKDGASQHDHYIYGWPKRDV